MSSILVTGGAGFIGSNFVVKWLDEESMPLVVLDRLTYAGNMESLGSVLNHPRFYFVQGDIGDRGLVDDLLRAHDIVAVVHLAAESHVDRSIDQPDIFVQTNVVGTYQLLTAALAYWRDSSVSVRKQFRFVHVSTDEVYGSLGPTGRFSETTPYAPNSPYAASKAAADHFVRAYHSTYGLPVLITNCSNNYGPRQFPEKLVPLMILNAIEGKPLPVYGDGKNIRDWLFVEDHCRALRAVLARGRPGDVYCIGGDCEVTNLEIILQICATVDRLCPGLPHAPCESLIEFVADRPGHDRRYGMDAGKIRLDLGWSAEVELRDGLERTVRWYLENQTWVQNAARGHYRRERLGLAGGRL
jgi:dTDP-glucose 4,6-dehydratase